MNFPGDSFEYEQLTEAALQIKGVEGLVLEIGTRRGCGIHTIMEACLRNKDYRYFVGVDPYGGAHYSNQMMVEFLANIYSYCAENNLFYRHFLLEDAEFMKQNSEGVVVYDYIGNEKIVGSHGIVQSGALPAAGYEIIKQASALTGVSPHHLETGSWKQLGDETVEKVREALTQMFGFEEKRLVNTYALVHIDGVHELAFVMAATKFFIPRVAVGGFIVYDDVNIKTTDYQHTEIDNTLLAQGFEAVVRG